MTGEVLRSDQEWQADVIQATSGCNRLCGRVYKSDRIWLADIPSLDVMTQGLTKSDGFVMIKDLLETLVNRPGFSVDVHPNGLDGFAITASTHGSRTYCPG